MKNTDLLGTFPLYHMFYYGGCQYILRLQKSRNWTFIQLYILKYTDSIVSMAGL